MNKLIKLAKKPRRKLFILSGLESNCVLVPSGGYSWNQMALLLDTNTFIWVGFTSERV